MFGGYTIAQVAAQLDLSEDEVRQIIAEGAIPSFRRFWLFGSTLFDKAMIDELAPDLRGLTRRKPDGGDTNV